MTSLRWKDLISPKKWKSFVVGSLLNKFLGLAYCEQVVWRTKQCPECVEAGQCHDCGCAMPAKAMDPNASCSLKRWGPMYKEGYWQVFKNLYKI